MILDREALDILATLVLCNRNLASMLLQGLLVPVCYVW